jgi:inner membrane protein
MRFKTHLAFSFCIFLLLIYYFNNFFENLSSFDKLIISFIFIIASIIPDIDNSESKIGRHIKPISWFLKHRGFFHSIFLPLIISLPIYFYNKYYAIAFFIGYFSHLLLDMLNYKGIMLFYPLSNFKIKGFIKSDGLFDSIIFVIFIVLMLFLIYLIN